jgi:hypothetical protein
MGMRAPSQACASFAVVAAAVISLLVIPVAARADRTPLIAVNQQLSAIAHSDGAGPKLQATDPRSIAAPTLHRNSASIAEELRLRLPPALLRLTRANRLLEVRTNSISANFWGVFGWRHGGSIKFSMHF